CFAAPSDKVASVRQHTDFSRDFRTGSLRGQAAATLCLDHHKRFIHAWFTSCAMARCGSDGPAAIDDHKGVSMLNKSTLVALLASVSLSAVAFADDLDPRYKDYTPTSGVSGTLKSIGSDTLNNLMTLWAEDFKKIYPGVKIEIEGKGSSTAPPALIAG